MCSFGPSVGVGVTFRVGASLPKLNSIAHQNCPRLSSPADPSLASLPLEGHQRLQLYANQEKNEFMQKHLPLEDNFRQVHNCCPLFVHQKGQLRASFGSHHSVDKLQSNKTIEVENSRSLVRKFEPSIRNSKGQVKFACRRSTNEWPSVSASSFNLREVTKTIESLDPQLHTLKATSSTQLNSEANQKMMQSMHSQHQLADQMQMAAAAVLREQQQQLAGNSALNLEATNSTGKGKLGRLMGKKASRLKELVLQNLGRADKTHDELFQIYEENFNKQQTQALKLQKDFKLYVNSLKGSHEASRNLNNCIQQSTGDYQSARHDLVCENLAHFDHLSADLLDKLRDQISANISEYLSQFAELREKISKRRRKLIDFDSSRRSYELMVNNIQKKRLKQQRAAGRGEAQLGISRGLKSALSLSSSAGQLSVAGATSADLTPDTNQLVDEARLLKMREQFNYSKLMYETINGELHEELPMVYERKMKHLLMTLQNYFSLEAQFHANASKLFATVSDVVDELPMASIGMPIGQGRDGRANSISETNCGQDNCTKTTCAHSASSNSHSTDYPDSSSVDYHKAMQLSGGVSGSSGMGSSRGDSSMGEEEDEHEHDDHQQVSHHPNGPEQFAEVIAIQSQEEQPNLEDDRSEQLGEEESAPSSPKSSEDSQGHLDESQWQAVAAEVVPEAIDDTNEKQTCQQEETYNDSTENKGAEITEPSSTDEPSNPEMVIELVPSDKIQPVTQSSDCLYKVKTTYKYLAEDVDELCFEADEIIQVIPFEEKQEQEEGWLMGLREVNGQRGLFPANFTRPI